MYVHSCKRKVKSFVKKGYHKETIAWEWSQTRGNEETLKSFPKLQKQIEELEREVMVQQYEIEKMNLTGGFWKSFMMNATLMLMATSLNNFRYAELINQLIYLLQNSSSYSVY